MALFAAIPLAIGITIIFILNQTKLAKALFIFLFFASIWQLDVAILYANHFLPMETIDMLFRALRFGSVLLTPALFYVAYVIGTENKFPLTNKIWKIILHKNAVYAFYIWSFLVYLVGWNKEGIESFIVIKSDKYMNYLFPIYGDFSWIFNLNVVLFLFSTVVCFILSRRIQKKMIRTFLLYFILATSVGYGIGILNMIPESRLYPSGIAVMVFAVSTLVLVTQLHSKIVKEMNNELENQKSFLRTIIDLNPNYIYAKSLDGTYSLANASFSALFEKKPDDILGKTDAELINPLHKCQNVLMTEQEILHLNNKTFIPEESIVNESGETRWLQTVKIPIFIAGNKHLLGVSTDITDRKNQEEKIRFQALHDVLTGIPNRRYFNQTIDEKIKNNNEQFAILLIDLDRFKYINDTLGHEVGDSILIEIANRLNKLLEGFTNLNPTLYRLGGDEFILTITFTTLEDINHFAQSVVDSFTKSFYINKNKLFLTPSIGISMFPRDGHDRHTLLKNADSAMYHVKEHGKNGFRIFSPEMQHKFYRKMIIEKELRNGLKQQEMYLHYQPKLDLSTNQVFGMEVLVRWESSNLGFVSPVEFIPIAEETGLIIPVGEWIIRTACTQNLEWKNRGYPLLHLAINISIRQLLDPNFVDTISNIIHETGHPPEYIELEITESIAMNDQDSIISKLSALKRLGFRISIDDFGTGYSSLSYLKRYPIDTLKIDKSFVKDIKNNKENTAIVKSIISMAHHLNLTVVAEGVENREELEFLKCSQCNFAQGYFISHPLSNVNFEKNILTVLT